jgi:hypothetical protein
MGLRMLIEASHGFMGRDVESKFHRTTRQPLFRAKFQMSEFANFAGVL